MIDLSGCRRSRSIRERHGAGAGRCDVGRLQRCDVRLRAGDHGRHHLDDRRRWADAGRRDRLPGSRLRAVLRQPALGRGRDRGRPLADRERQGERGPVLGAARRRWQLRRRDLVGVPAHPVKEIYGGPMLFELHDAADRPAVLPGLHQGRARAVRRIPGVPDRAAAAVHPGGSARRHVPRLRRLLGGPSRRASAVLKPLATSRRSSPSTSARCRTRRSTAPSTVSCRRACSTTGRRTSSPS